MDNLNQPTIESLPAHWLQHGFITRLAQEVEEAIRCIVENDVAQTIPDEAQRMRARGLEDCYRSFPYQQDVYAFCKITLAKEHDHLLRPLFDAHDACVKADAARLGYQLQQMMICALYSVELTRGGTCIPSYDSEGQLDIVELDPNLLGQKAESFWQNLPWTIIHFYRATIGPGSFPADISAFYEQVPLWQGDVEYGKALAKQLMADAFAAKAALIPDGAFFSIEQGGTLAAVRLREFGAEILATFYDRLGGFIQASINPRYGDWKLNMHPSASVKVEFYKTLERSRVFEKVPESDRGSVYDKRFDLWIQQIEVGVGVFLATLVRDLWVADRRKKIFPRELVTKKERTKHPDQLSPVAVELPRVQYVAKISEQASDRAS